jgi:S-formylglutathione hydrolase FrmB
MTDFAENPIRISRFGLTLAACLLVVGCQNARPAAPLPATVATTATKARAMQGRLETVSLPTTRLGVAKTFQVYLPPGYPGGGPYPTLYLLRGTSGEWLNPDQDGSRQGRTAVSVYEGLRQRGTIGDMILVFPGLGSDDGRWPGILADWVAPPKAPGVGNGRFASYFADDVMAAVDSRYRTLADGHHRAVDGFSLGGWAAVQAAVSQPAAFSSVGSFDGTFPFAKDATTADPDDELWEESFFDPIFGAPRDWARVTAASPANRLAKGSDWSRQQWLIEYCPQAIEPRGNFYRGATLVQILKAHGGKNTLSGERPGGTHAWWWADEHLTTTLPHHWRQIKP